MTASQTLAFPCFPMVWAQIGCFTHTLQSSSCDCGGQVICHLSQDDTVLTGLNLQVCLGSLSEIIFSKCVQNFDQDCVYTHIYTHRHTRIHSLHTFNRQPFAAFRRKLLGYAVRSVGRPPTQERCCQLEILLHSLADIHPTFLLPCYARRLVTGAELSPFRLQDLHHPAEYFGHRPDCQT